MNASDRARKPLIGLTTYRQRAQSGVWDTEASFLPGVYLEAVTRSGGIAVLLPPQAVDSDVAATVLSRLDALVLTGGRDIDPAAYGQESHPTTDAPDHARDAWEFALLDAALERGVPVLGICRGAELLNVRFGGTLHQHLPDVLGSSGHRTGDGVFAVTAVHTVPGTRLSGMLGGTAQGRCYHHQGIDRLGDGLVVSANAEDGLVEGVEMAGPDFVVAVQWHPEESLDDLRIFTGLVDAARAFATEKASL